MPQTIERPAAAGEVHFGLDEIFYSRTDHRGIIRAGNDVFSVYGAATSWPESAA